MKNLEYKILALPYGVKIGAGLMFLFVGLIQFLCAWRTFWHWSVPVGGNVAAALTVLAILASSFGLTLIQFGVQEWKGRGQ